MSKQNWYFLSLFLLVITFFFLIKKIKNYGEIRKRKQFRNFGNFNACLQLKLKKKIKLKNYCFFLGSITITRSRTSKSSC